MSIIDDFKDAELRLEIKSYYPRVPGQCDGGYETKLWESMRPNPEKRYAVTGPIISGAYLTDNYLEAVGTWLDNGQWIEAFDAKVERGEV